MVNDGRQHLQTEPWPMIVPGLAIGLTVLAANILGDVLRDVTDPRAQG